MLDICNYDCFHCRFPDCMSNLYLGREKEAHAMVMRRLAAGEKLAKLTAEPAERNRIKGGTKSDWMKRWRAKMKEQGRCVFCGKPAELNPKTGKPYSHCPERKAKDAERQKARYERKKGQLKRKRQER